MPLQAVQQVAFADRLLLNKTDLVTAAEKAEVIRAIKARASSGDTASSSTLHCNKQSAIRSGESIGRRHESMHQERLRKALALELLQINNRLRSAAEGRFLQCSRPSQMHQPIAGMQQHHYAYKAPDQPPVFPACSPAPSPVSD